MIPQEFWFVNHLITRTSVLTANRQIRYWVNSYNKIVDKVDKSLPTNLIGLRLSHSISAFDALDTINQICPPTPRVSTVRWKTTSHQVWHTTISRPLWFMIIYQFHHISIYTYNEIYYNTLSTCSAQCGHIQHTMTDAQHTWWISDSKI